MTAAMVLRVWWRARGNAPTVFRRALSHAQAVRILDIALHSPDNYIGGIVWTPYDSLVPIQEA